MSAILIIAGTKQDVEIQGELKLLLTNVVNMQVSTLADLQKGKPMINTVDFQADLRQFGALVLLCSKDLTLFVQNYTPIRVHMNDVDVNLEGTAIPSCIENVELKRKIVLLSAQTIWSVPTGLEDNPKVVYRGDDKDRAVRDLQREIYRIA